MDKFRPHIFFTAIVLFAAAVVAILLFRANPPVEKQVQNKPKREFTYGNFIQGPVIAPKGEMLAFKFDLNRKASLNGKFATQNYRPRLTCYVVTAENFELMKNGAEFQSVTSTGEVPGGRVTRTFEPGIYYVVFDNRKGAADIVISEADFSIE